MAVEHIPDVEGLMLCTSLIPNDFDPHQWYDNNNEKIFRFAFLYLLIQMFTFILGG